MLGVFIGLISREDRVFMYPDYEQCNMHQNVFSERKGNLRNRKIRIFIFNSIDGEINELCRFHNAPATRKCLLERFVLHTFFYKQPSW